MNSRVPFPLRHLEPIDSGESGPDSYDDTTQVSSGSATQITHYETKTGGYGDTDTDSDD